MAIGTVHHLCFVAGLAVLGCSYAPSEATEQNNESSQGSRAAPDPQQNAGVYPPEDVTGAADIRRVISYFDENLTGFEQRVRSCGDIVRIQIGKDSLIYGRGLAAYGAHCTLGNGHSVAMCYEEASGRSAIVSGSLSPERPWITAFTSRTCAEL